MYPPSEAELPAEYEALTVVLAGAEAPAAMEVWRELSAALGVGARIDQSKPPAGLHPTRSATLQAGKDPLGGVGEVHPAVLQAFDVSERVAILEIDLDQLLDREPKPAQWKPTSRYPSSDLDLAFVLPDDVDAERLDKAIRQGSGNLLVDLDAVRRLSRRSRGRRDTIARVPTAAPGRRSQPHRRRHRQRAPRGRGGGHQARGRAAKLTP